MSDFSLFSSGTVSSLPDTRNARAKDPRVVQVMAGLAGEYDVVLVVRSDGVLAADIRPLVRVSVTEVRVKFSTLRTRSE